MLSVVCNVQCAMCSVQCLVCSVHFQVLWLQYLIPMTALSLYLSQAPAVSAFHIHNLLLVTRKLLFGLTFLIILPVLLRPLLVKGGKQGASEYGIIIHLFILFYEIQKRALTITSVIRY